MSALSLYDDANQRSGYHFVLWMANRKKYLSKLVEITFRYSIIKND